MNDEVAGEIEVLRLMKIKYDWFRLDIKNLTREIKKLKKQIPAQEKKIKHLKFRKEWGIGGPIKH